MFWCSQSPSTAWYLSSGECVLCHWRRDWLRCGRIRVVCGTTRARMNNEQIIRSTPGWCYFMAHWIQTIKIYTFHLQTCEYVYRNSFHTAIKDTRLVFSLTNIVVGVSAKSIKISCRQRLESQKSCGDEKMPHFCLRHECHTDSIVREHLWPAPLSAS